MLSSRMAWVGLDFSETDLDGDGGSGGDDDEDEEDDDGELAKALDFQKNSKDNLYTSLKEIKLGTNNFSDCNCVGEGRLWKLYKGEFRHVNGFAKRWDSMSRQGYCQFLRELEVLVTHNHKNIIGLLGYCNEENEKNIIYEYACNGRLSEHLCDPRLTWLKRLKICIGIAEGLDFLHTCGGEHEFLVKHRDIKSGSIFLDSDFNAKISNFELSCNLHECDTTEHVSESLGYVDPAYEYWHYIGKESDIYSLGVILIEMLCGRLAWEKGCEDHSQSLGPLAVRRYKKNGNLDGMIFEGIKGQIVAESLIAFQSIAFHCLEVARERRPEPSDVVTQLERALKFQEGYEIWETKLPVDYKEIIRVSKTPTTYNCIEMKKDLYDMFTKGILLHDGKVLFSFGVNGERNELVSARKFSYINRTSHKWRYVPESRRSVKHEDTAKLKQDEEQAFKSKSLTDKLWWSMWQSSKGQKLLLPAKKVVNNSSNVAITSRFNIFRAFVS
ncbi:hypothetical protein QVD17_18115 [Tagetes erecta]|uniref:Protein kinase domain-containing protein n=1 Tax=Tagetes erecta TaxID=13708 RepID=A0AAD8KK16_TARER|nr:hypothetical protein QVD17_18115 [Tagetes erecta]